MNFAQQINFDLETVNILLPLTPVLKRDAVIESIAKNRGLNIKNEFHCTIIGRETGEHIRTVLAVLSKEEQKNKILEIKNLCEKYSWKCTFLQEYYVVSKEYTQEDKRESIVQMVELFDIKNFYFDLNSALGTDFKVPLPHITLDTKSSQEDKNLRGVGIYSEEQFHSLNPVKIVRSLIKIEELVLTLLNNYIVPICIFTGFRE